MSYLSQAFIVVVFVGCVSYCATTTTGLQVELVVVVCYTSAQLDAETQELRSRQRFEGGNMDMVSSVAVVAQIQCGHQRTVAN